MTSTKFVVVWYILTISILTETSSVLNCYESYCCCQPFRLRETTSSQHSNFRSLVANSHNGNQVKTERDHDYPNNNEENGASINSRQYPQNQENVISGGYLDLSYPVEQSSSPSLHWLPPYNPPFNTQNQPPFNLPGTPPFEPSFNPQHQPQFELQFNPQNQPSFRPPLNPSYKPPFESLYNPQYQPMYGPSYRPPLNLPNEPPYPPVYDHAYKPPFKPLFEPNLQPVYRPVHQTPTYRPPPLPQPGPPQPVWSYPQPYPQPHPQHNPHEIHQVPFQPSAPVAVNTTHEPARNDSTTTTTTTTGSLIGELIDASISVADKLSNSNEFDVS